MYKKPLRSRICSPSFSNHSTYTPPASPHLCIIDRQSCHHTLSPRLCSCHEGSSNTTTATVAVTVTNTDPTTMDSITHAQCRMNKDRVRTLRPPNPYHSSLTGVPSSPSHRSSGWEHDLPQRRAHHRRNIDGDCVHFVSWPDDSPRDAFLDAAGAETVWVHPSMQRHAHLRRCCAR